MNQELKDKIVFTGVYKPKWDVSLGYMDNQYYGLSVPFIVNDRIVFVDTYHISFYGIYSAYVEQREKEVDVNHNFVPYISNYYYKHYKYVDTVSELEKNFELLLDLKECKPVTGDEVHFYKDKFSNISLWFECCYRTSGYTLIKKDAKHDYGKKIAYLMNEIYSNITGSDMYLSSMGLSELEDAVKTADENGYWYDKKFYDGLMKYVEFIQDFKKQQSKMLTDLFDNRYPYTDENGEVDLG